MTGYFDLKHEWEIDSAHHEGDAWSNRGVGPMAVTMKTTSMFTAPKVTQVEPSDGFVARQALVDGYAHKTSKDPAAALQPIRKDAKELKERFTTWSLSVAEFEHQFKAIDEAQKTLVVREMTGPSKFDEIMEKLEMIINEMMADDGPVPMDLGHVGTHDAKMNDTERFGHEQRHVI